jgi:hypothetical protein
MPGVRTLPHPAFLRWREAFGPFWTRLHLDAPRGAMGRHPGLEHMRMILMISKDCFETGKVVRIELLEQCRGRHAIIQPRTRDQPGPPQAQGIDPQMPLAPLHLLAARIAALGTAPLRRVDRRAIDARGTGRGLPARLPAGLFAHCRQQRDPRAIVAPPRTGVVHRPLGQSMVWEHLPWTPASIQRQERIHHFAPVDFSWASPTLGEGRWKPRCQNRPWCVR